MNTQDRMRSLMLKFARRRKNMETKHR